MTNKKSTFNGRSKIGSCTEHKKVLKNVEKSHDNFEYI